MKLTFCAACGVKDDLQHHHLATGAEGGSNDETNLITVCCDCLSKLYGRQRLGAVFADLAALPAYRATEEMNRRGILTANGSNGLQRKS
jgi:hypothetical protein